VGLILKDKIIYRLSKEYSKCEQAVFITAYLTSGIFDILGNLDHFLDRKTMLFVRGNKQDFINGSVCIKTLRRLHNANIQCFLLQNLHAKLYIFDKQAMFIGSANLTNNGLSLSPNSNIEILHHAPYSKEMDAQVQIMLKGATVLTDDLLNGMSLELQEHHNIITDQMGDEWACIPIQSNHHLTDLSVEHLPKCHLDHLYDSVKQDDFYHDQQLFGLQNDGEIDIELFQDSVLHHFLIKALQRQPDCFMRFGTVKQLIAEQCNLSNNEHLTSLVQNIYSYYKYHTNTEIQYIRPQHTEVLSLITEAD